MYNYICLTSLLKDNDLNFKNLVNYYISYISIFNCTNVDVNDSVLNDKITDLENYINRKVSE